MFQNLQSHLLQSLRTCLSSFCDTTKYFSKPRILHESPIDDLVILTPLSTRIYYLKFDGVKHAGPSIEVIMPTTGTRFLHWNQDQQVFHHFYGIRILFVIMTYLYLKTNQIVQLGISTFKRCAIKNIDVVIVKPHPLKESRSLSAKRHFVIKIEYGTMGNSKKD